MSTSTTAPTGSDLLVLGPPASPTRVAVAGLGPQAREHLIPVLLGLDDVRVVALVDPEPLLRHDVGARLGVRAGYADLSRMLAEEPVDCVVAACPPQAHEQIAAACIEASMPVFVEKPPALHTRTLRELADAADAADAKQLTTGVGMNFRWAAPVAHLRALLDSGAYGSVDTVFMRHMASKPRASMWGQDLWRSFLLAQAVHPVDLLVHLAGGAPTRVRSTHRLGADHLTIAAHVDFDNGVIGALLTGTQAPRFEHRVEISTSTGATLSITDLAEVAIGGGALAQGPSLRGETRHWRPSPMNIGYERTGFATELAGFVHAVARREAFHASLADVTTAYRIMDDLAAQEATR
jgi:phthalate 4,5-cis-dihydrodiol dehydrogenase